MSDKIENLLAQAEAQMAAASGAMSSIARAERGFANGADAEKAFAALEEKLFRVEKWNAHSRLMSFELFGEDGNPRTRERARRGDFVRITLIGSGKSDWVKIVRFDEAADEIVLTLQPAPNPTETGGSDEAAATSHFFTRDSTNNFCLKKKNSLVSFYVLGLNEKTNLRDTKNIVETARNAAVANLGHYLGIQEYEWQAFCEEFLNK